MPFDNPQFNHRLGFDYQNRQLLIETIENMMADEFGYEPTGSWDGNAERAYAALCHKYEMPITLAPDHAQFSRKFELAIAPYYDRDQHRTVEQRVEETSKAAQEKKEYQEAMVNEPYTPEGGAGPVVLPELEDEDGDDGDDE